MPAKIDYDHVKAHTTLVIGGKYQKVVAQFAAAMVDRLEANDHKGCWRSKEWHPQTLLQNLEKAYRNFGRAVFYGGDVHEEAVDLANMALIVCDKQNFGEGSE